MNSVSAKLATKYGDFKITVYHAEKGLEPTVLSTPEIDTSKPVLVRIHDECMTGDTFGSLRCDCGNQKKESLKMITDSKNGLFIYMRQEGRGIGLYEKIKTYKLQDEGFDTHEANIQLGHNPDCRDYLVATEILKNLGVKQIHLITNNPSKISEISRSGIEVIKQIPLITEVNEYNQEYMRTKKMKFRHSFNGQKISYFIGINGIENLFQVEDIANFVRENKKDVLLEIYISNDTLDLESLSDEIVLLKTREVFSAVEKYDDLVAMLHYSFEHSINPMEDLKLIKEKLPFVKYIQLDDIQKNHLEILKHAVNNFSVVLPITDIGIDLLLDDQDFIDFIITNKIPILLDNSLGKGVRETSDKYKKKILKFLNKGINNIALAGGFSADYLDTYFEMVDYFRINLSIDAASGLQTGGRFDIEKTKRYIGNIMARKYL